MVVVTLGLFILVGCKPASKDGARAYTSTQRTDVVNGTGSVFPTSCSSGQSAIGTIFDSSYSNTISFEERVKNFLSATTAPSDVGTISSAASDYSTGVRFQGMIKLDSSGRVVLGSSKISIKVYDSYVASQGLNPIAVTINTASAGQFNLSTGVGYVTFKDAYGEIRFDGKIDAQYFSGTVSYTNSTTVVENASPSAGSLGQFAIATCGAVQ